MIIQTYKTQCKDCGETVKASIGDTTGENEIIVEFIDGLEFHCNCGTTTLVEIEKYTL